jgi:hypothetical protein
MGSRCRRAGVTVRTPVGVPDTLQLRQDLPALPGIRLMLYRAESSATVGCQRLSDIVSQALQDYLHGLGGVCRIRHLHAAVFTQMNACGPG